MHAVDPSPAAPDEEAARLIQEQLDPVAPPPGDREALLRRILERTGGPAEPAPAPPPKVG